MTKVLITGGGGTYLTERQLGEDDEVIVGADRLATA
jgi:hypothetical protein